MASTETLERRTASLETRPTVPNGAVHEPRPDRFGAIDIALAVAVAALICLAAFIGNGGLQLGATTFVEVMLTLVSGLTVAAAVVIVGFGTRLRGGFALAAMALLAVLTTISIAWSLYPSESWIEANRTISYLMVFAGAIAAVRLVHRRWQAVLFGVLAALAIITFYGLATKVAPGLLDPDQIFARLREPYGYWNAVGVTAAMGVPLCAWLGTRDDLRTELAALAYPLLGAFLLAILLSYSRGSILAAVVALGLWLVFVPRRLHTTAVVAPPAIVAGLVAAWVFSQGALSDDRIALSEREGPGIVFGIVLALSLALLYALGVAITRRARTDPLSAQARRRAGIAWLVALGLVPFVLLAAMATTERGIGGTISDRWQDLTHQSGTPTNDPGRLTETGSVRTIYWARAIKVGNHHKFKGAGAGSFDKAQLRFRTDFAQGRHAHGYLHQTFADLGLLGLAVSLLALGAWLVAIVSTLGLWRGRLRRPWGLERTGLAALALAAIAFGVHSTIDWTWFVPGVAFTGLLAAGWVAGRGPLLGPERRVGAAELDGHPQRLPGRRTMLRRAPAAAFVAAMAILLSLSAIAPWRAQRNGDRALDRAAAGDFSAARELASDAKAENPLSPEPFFDLAAIEMAAGQNRAALRQLQLAVQREPANPAAWQRLGDFYVRMLDRPSIAIPILQAAVYLDPVSNSTRGSLLLALRAQMIQRQQLAQRRARARAARLLAPPASAAAIPQPVIKQGTPVPPVQQSRAP